MRQLMQSMVDFHIKDIKAKKRVSNGDFEALEALEGFKHVEK